MKLDTIKHVIALTATALALGVVASIALAPFAKAEDAPVGFAEAQRAALWSAIRTSVQLEGVDQVVIEGAGDGPILTGWLMRRNWTGAATNLERRFWSRVDRVCVEVRPECFRVIGIWSNGVLVSHLNGG